MRTKARFLQQLRAMAAVAMLAAPASAQNRLPVDPAADYGSIAYAPSSGRWGHSFNYRSEQEAVSVAMQHCTSAGGRDCRTVVWVSNGCGAVAIAGSNRNFVAANGKYQPEAEVNALARCRSSYRGACSIKVWVCTSP